MSDCGCDTGGYDTGGCDNGSYDTGGSFDTDFTPYFFAPSISPSSNTTYRRTRAEKLAEKHILADSKSIEDAMMQKRGVVDAIDKLAQDDIKRDRKVAKKPTGKTINDATKPPKSKSAKQESTKPETTTYIWNGGIVEVEKPKHKKRRRGCIIA